MNTREKIIHALTELADGILVAKGKDYTAGNWETDPNYNFHEIAKLLQGAPITPYTVCMIYFLKHVFSLIKFCKTGTQEGGEGLEGRHADALNYVRILWSLAAEGTVAELDDESGNTVDLVDPVEVHRITGIDLRNWTNTTNYSNPWSCPAEGTVAELDDESEQHWLDRVNAQFNNNQKL